MHQRTERLGRQTRGGGARDGAALDLGFARLVDDGQAGRPLRRGHRRHEHQAPADQVDHAGQRRGRRRRGAVVKPARTRSGQPAVGLAGGEPAVEVAGQRGVRRPQQIRLAVVGQRADDDQVVAAEGASARAHR